MINPFHDINWSPDHKELKKFGTTMLIGFSVFAVLVPSIRLLLGAKFAQVGWLALILFGIGFVVFILSKIAPSLVKLIYYPWYGIAACIGLVVSNLLLILFFYAIFTPYAVIVRVITRRDPLNLKNREKPASYWVEREPQKDLKRYFKQY